MYYIENLQKVFLLKKYNNLLAFYLIDFNYLVTKPKRHEMFYQESKVYLFKSNKSFEKINRFLYKY